MKNKKKAFTLAEIMIAMTIVGVIASMTIPNLLYKRTKTEYSTKLKTYYSKTDNAIVDMQTEFGPFQDMTAPTTDPFEWYLENIDPYLGHQLINKDIETVYFKDGSNLSNFQSSNGETSCFEVDYDTNGAKNPNKYGADIYKFAFCFSDADREAMFGRKDVFFGSYSEGLSQTSTRATMISTCQNKPETCTRLLQTDLWEYKKDYPIK